MPSAAVDFRPVCGTFVPIFVGFMLKRAKMKAQARFAIVKVVRKVEGAAFGLLLSYLFWGSLLLRCGDIESHPGPNRTPGTENTVQTRLTRSGSLSRSTNVESPDTRHSDVSTPTADATLNEVLKAMQNMKEEMKDEVKKQTAEVRKDVQHLRDDNADFKRELLVLREEVTELRRENQDLKKKNGDLSEKLAECEKKIDDLECRSKRSNLIFYGLPRSPNETPADCEDLLRGVFREKLDLTEEVPLDRVHRLSTKPDAPIIACFTFFKQKSKVLKLKGKLKGSNIFIGEDLSKGVRDLRRRLNPHLKAAKQSGKRASMLFNYLLIEGQKFTVDDGDHLVPLK